MLYTRKGDDGMSGLFGIKDRFSKDALVYEALGSVDELNMLLGVCRAKASHKKRKKIDVAEEILQVQEMLFVAQAELAGAPKYITEAQLKRLEGKIEEIEKEIENPRGFVVAGASELSALLDYARAVTRRAERAVIRSQVERGVGVWTRCYLNRLSSFLFALARFAAKEARKKELSPSY